MNNLLDVYCVEACGEETASQCSIRKGGAILGGHCSLRQKAKCQTLSTTYRKPNEKLVGDLDGLMLDISGKVGDMKYNYPRIIIFDKEWI